MSHRGEDLRAVLDELTKAVLWEDMGATVDLASADVAEVLSSAVDGDVLDFSKGSVAVQVSVTKSTTMRGEAAGVRQNFAQEV